MKKFRVASAKVARRARQIGAGVAAFALAGVASATVSTKDQVLAEVTAVQTDGVAIAGAVTLMIFMIAAAKWLRRAK
jgi:hypothetical protein